MLTALKGEKRKESRAVAAAVAESRAGEGQDELRKVLHVTADFPKWW